MMKYNIWNDIEVELLSFDSTNKNSDACVIILPGGAYSGHAEYEGAGYAHMFNMLGVTAFVLKYRVAPNRFPCPLLDARRAVRFIRAHAEEFAIDKNKILVIGSSAGGHLTALLSTYKGALEGEGIDEIDTQEYLPNGQILCYPVICSEETIGHMGSYHALLGEAYHDKEKYSPELLVEKNTPKAFIWHTSSDEMVSVINSYRYAEALSKANVLCEMHIFPVGRHGCGVGASLPYVSKWVELLRQWMILNNFI